LAQLPGEFPTQDDWSDHLTTLFPEVRMKRFLEMRGADGGRWRRICALPALWTGLLYDRVALDAAWDLVKDWTAEERQGLRNRAPQTALRTPFRRTSVLELARAALAIAQSGLERRTFLNAKGEDERIFLDPIAAILDESLTPADEILLRYERDWGRRTDPLFREYAF
jgi:glutamate--cysteine ligase